MQSGRDTTLNDKIAHHIGPCSKTGHGEAFRTFTIENGGDASAYFTESGIASFADMNGGLCSFQLNENMALYQSKNIPLLNDIDLEPSINANAELFGSFIGAMESDTPLRNKKRAVVERVFGNARFVHSLSESIEKNAEHFISRHIDEIHNLDDFIPGLISYIDSHLPGVLDLNEKPLSDYLSDEKYSIIAKSFFELASEVISKVNHEAIKNTDMICDMTKDILRKNFSSIEKALRTNVIKAQFSVLGYEFTQENIERLSADELKELGTIIIASYDTTSLSFIWLLLYLNENKKYQTELIKKIKNESNYLDYAMSLVLEAIRISGNNPTALWRKVKKDCNIEVNNEIIIIPEGTILWLDRRYANRDRNHFSEPGNFNVENISYLFKNDSPLSVLNKGHYEINSFNMINTKDSRRKCPGRIFSVIEQAVLLILIIKKYEFSIVDYDLNLAPFFAMPRPTSTGRIVIKNQTNEAV